MNQREFLKELKSALEQSMTNTQANVHIDFYSNYIKNEVGNGKKEGDVINELGDPWALAKNLEAVEPESMNQSTMDNYSGYGKQGGQPKVYTANGKWVLIALLVIVLIIVILGVSLIGGIISVLSPILIPLLIISIIFKIFRK